MGPAREHRSSKIKFKQLFAALFTALFSAVLFGASRANAVSIWDDVVLNVNSLPVTDGGSNSYIVTESWLEEFQQCNDWSTVMDNIANQEGRWGITQDSSSSGYKGVTMVATWDDNEAVSWNSSHHLRALVPMKYYASLYATPGGVACSANYQDGYYELASEPYTVIGATTYRAQPFFATYDMNYPYGYEGAYVNGESPVDGDTDGLNQTQELTQGTSDSLIDTDGDGLSDLIESEWYVDREEVFCKTDPPANVCAYPNPIKQDVYVEIDWMEKDSIPLKPTSTQLEAVADAFEAQDIALHFDSSEYGGGNLVPYEEILEFDPVVGLDFYDYKRGGDGISTGYFNEDRVGIWRYMISGDTYNDGDSNTSTGRAELGDDDLFISYDSNLLVDDTAVSGTIMHELGHSLCMTIPPETFPSSVWYYGQDPSCLFEGIHKYSGYDDYDSSMSYANQLTLVDYSDGSNPTGDHDDWSAVKLFGINDFVEFNFEDPEEPTMFSRNSQQNTSQPPEASEEEFRRQLDLN